MPDETLDMDEVRHCAKGEPHWFTTKLARRILELESRSPSPAPTDTETQRRAEAATNAVLCAAIELTIKAIDAQDDEKIPRHAQVVDYAAIIRTARARSSSPSSGIATDDLRVVVSREDARQLIDADSRTAFVSINAGSYFPEHGPATDALRRIVKQLRSPLPSSGDAPAVKKEPCCPQCGKALERVTYPSDSMLNRDQWESVRAGDWWCEACPSNGRGRSGAYFWNREIVSGDAPATPEDTTAANDCTFPGCCHPDEPNTPCGQCDAFRRKMGPVREGICMGPWYDDCADCINGVPTEIPDFAALLKHGREQTGCAADVIPWSFNWHGLPVTHENDNLYLLTTPTETLRIARSHSETPK